MEEAEAGPLNAERAERILRLEEKMTRRMEDEELTPLFRDLEMPLVDVLAGMELAGIAIDRDEFAAMAKTIDKDIDVLTKEIYELAGVEFNINSPRQLGEILFDKMNLPSFKKTEKQRAASTRVEVIGACRSSWALTSMRFRIW
jgi:DNA polymerase-1